MERDMKILLELEGIHFLQFRRQEIFLLNIQKNNLKNNKSH